MYKYTGKTFKTCIPTIKRRYTNSQNLPFILLQAKTLLKLCDAQTSGTPKKSRCFIMNRIQRWIKTWSRVDCQTAHLLYIFADFQTLSTFFFRIFSMLSNKKRPNVITYSIIKLIAVKRFSYSLLIWSIQIRFVQTNLSRPIKSIWRFKLRWQINTNCIT